MKRFFLVTSLLALFAFAILATSFDSLVAAPSGQSQVVASATLHFDGTVTQVNEERGLLTVSGTAVLSNILAPLTGTWQASAMLPFRRNPGGAIQIARQGELRIRVVRAGNTYFTMVANLADITSVISVLNGVHTVVVDGDADVVASDGSEWDWLETEVWLEDTLEAGTLNAPTLEGTMWMATVITMWTQYPTTSTPNAPHTQGPTSQPTVASPGL